MRPATKARWPNDDEWRIATSVFRSNLPSRRRIIVTDACGIGDAPFTIPSAALHAVPAIIAAAISGAAAGLAGRIAAPLDWVGSIVGGISNVTGVLPSVHYFAAPFQLASVVSPLYFVNVGARPYPDMTSGYRSLLVHELTHVWQGHNSVFALSYVINSAFHQCRGSARGGGRGAAYDYSPGLPWRAYNAEQQAEIVEDWYEAGMPESGELWHYIRNNVRLGFIGDHLPV
jgi:hypothetical protein